MNTDQAVRGLYQTMGIRPQVYDLGKEIEDRLKERFCELDQTAEYNQLKVLHAMQKNRVSEACFYPSTGYGYNDLGRDVLEQVYAVGRAMGKPVSHVVVMGTGEPLDNYDQLLRFIRILSHEQGMHMSQRNMTVSTCGIVPRIYDLAREKLQITLALSLHGATDAKRQKLMPIAKEYHLDAVMKACDHYFKSTGRRMTYEYSMVSGMNDTDQDAAELGRLLRGKNCHLNLIPVNPVKGRSFRQSDKKVVARFKNKLEKYGINVTIRREMGRDIDGACGQLRRRHMEEPPVAE